MSTSFSWICYVFVSLCFLSFFFLFISILLFYTPTSLSQALARPKDGSVRGRVKVKENKEIEKRPRKRQITSSPMVRGAGAAPASGSPQPWCCILYFLFNVIHYVVRAETRLAPKPKRGQARPDHSFINLASQSCLAASERTSLSVAKAPSASLLHSHTIKRLSPSGASKRAKRLCESVRPKGTSITSGVSM